jgi:hypothetical protein
MISLLVYVVVVVLIGWVAVWVLGRLAPGHPPIIDNIIWVLVVLFVILIVAQATGVLHHDIPVPQLR